MRTMIVSKMGVFKLRHLFYQVLSTFPLTCMFNKLLFSSFFIYLCPVRISETFLIQSRIVAGQSTALLSPSSSSSSLSSAFYSLILALAMLCKLAST